MAAENTGTAKISLELDLANYSLSVDKAKQQATGLGAAAEEAFNQSNSKAKQAAVSLARYISLVGKSADEAKALRAQWAGINTTVLDDLTGKLAAIRQEEEITNANTRMLAESFSDMQVKARAAFKDLQSAAREDQMMRDAAAARALSNELTSVQHAQDVAQRNFATAVQNTATYSGAYGERVNRMRDAVAAFTSQEFKNADALRNSGSAARAGGIEFNKYGLSAKQTAAALRQVPAQITDIFVSLQGGQRPLTVLLQQGGQLKDVFGGVVPAVKALSSALLGLLLNPIVLVTAAVAALAYAWKSGTDEQDAYNQSLILTGNYAAQTIGTMNTLAGRIGDTVSTQHAAATTLAEVAASGKIAAGSIELVTRAAEQMRVTTGKAVKETVAEFVSLADDPTKAIVKLNETQHFLTSGIYEQIKALQEQGDKQAAAALAEKTYADAIADRTKEIKANLGTVETAWNTLARGAKRAWDSMLDVGRPSVGDEKLLGLQAAANAAATAYENLKNKKPTSTWYSLNLQDKAYYSQWLADAKKRSDDATKAYHDEEHKQQAERDAATAGVARQQANEAAIALGQEAAKYEPAEKKRAADIAAAHKQANDAIAKLNSVSDAALIKTIRDNEAKVVAGLNAKGASGAHSLANAQADAQVQAIKDALTKEQALIQNDGKLLQAQYSARLVSAKDYYAQQSVLIDRDTKAQEKALTDQIAYLKTRDVAGKDSVKTNKDIGEAEAKLAKVRADGATAQKTLAIEEANATKQRELALRSYRDAFDSANASAKASADAAVARITLGEREAAQQEKIAAILAKSAEDQKALAREFADNKDTELYQEKLQALREYTDEQVQIATDGYARLQAAQADWLNGVKGGIANWMEQTKDVASQTTAITGRTLDAGANAFDQFAETGKADIQGMLRGIASDIAKFMARQAVLKFIQLFLPGGGAGTTSTYTPSSAQSGGGMFNAKGNVFSNSPSLSAYSGTVVSQPTPFMFAKGAGVMGEAGSEGIFPLERDSRGRLGITAQGVGGGDVIMSMSFVINSDGTNSSTSSANDDAKMYKSFMGEVGNLVESKINRAMMPGGQLWKAGVSTNG